jgi:hypothetical protein
MTHTETIRSRLKAIGATCTTAADALDLPDTTLLARWFALDVPGIAREALRTASCPHELVAEWGFRR